jgi:tetratricopeptide (TPR) repeat protein
MTRLIRAFALALVPLLAQAQVTTLTDSARASRRLWSLLRSLEETERRFLQASGGARIDSATAAKLEPFAVERDFARVAAQRLLDSVAFQTTWGYGEVRALLRTYPASGLLLQAALGVASRDRLDADVLDLSEKLLRAVPREVSTHIVRGAALERAARGAEARASFVRAFELAPEDSLAFRALVRMQQKDGTLTELLDRVERIVIRLPKSRVLEERRIELLQRLGRTREAEAAAKALRERPV